MLWILLGVIVGILIGFGIGVCYCPDCAERRELRIKQNQIDEMCRLIEIKYGLKEKR